MKKFSFLILGIFFQISLIADCSYDENGNISSIYIPENGEVLYRYDPIQRLTEARYPNGKHFSYTYDYNSNLRSIESPDGTTKYTYDRLIPFVRNNDIKSTVLPGPKYIFYLANLQKLGSISKCTFASKVSCAFVPLFLTNGINRIETAHLPDGSSLAYQYDLMGRVTSHGV